MAVVQTCYEHITFDEKGIPMIAGTTMKVVELIVEKIVHGWSAEELHFQHPYLSLGQIYSALAYYSDHQEEIDRDIERRLQYIDKLRHTSSHSPVVAKLKSKGLL